MFYFHPLLLLCGSSKVVEEEKKENVYRQMSFSWLPHIAKKKYKKRYLRVSLFATTLPYRNRKKCFHASLIFFFSGALWEGGNFPIRSDGDSLPNKYRYGPVNRLEVFFQWKTKNLKTLPGSLFPPSFSCFNFPSRR